MASWEDIVNRVVIGSNYFAVEDSSKAYAALFKQMTELHKALTDLHAATKDSWKGPAADAFRSHLANTASSVNDLREDHSRIEQGLSACSTHLQHAVARIPIPDWMYDEVAERQRAYSDHNTPLVKLFGTNDFFNGMQGIAGDIYSNIPMGGGGLFKSYEGWVTGFADKAQDAYNDLRTNYGGEYTNIPEGLPARTPTNVGGQPPYVPGGGHVPGGGGGTVPKFDASKGFDPTAFDPSTSSFDPTSAGTGGFDPSDLPGTSLAGVDPNFGGGGLPRTGFGPAGLAGGPSGLGGGGMRVPPLGPAINPVTGGMGMPGMGGMGAMGGRGGANRGRTSGIASGRGSASGARGPGGVMAGGRPGPGNGEGDERTTWLEEDEDVWGTSSNAPPGVLGG